MRSTRSFLTPALYVGVLLLAAAPTVLAHGGDEGAMNMDMGHGGSGHSSSSSMDGASIAANATEDGKVYPPTYFAHPEHRSLIYAHIFLMTVAWVFALPVSVMLSIARSRYTLPTQLAFLTTNIAGVIFSAVYNGKTPDLYPNNAHHKVGWIATWIVCAQVIISLLASISGSSSSIFGSTDENVSMSERQAFIPVSAQALAEHSSSLHSPCRSADFRFSNDSGQGTEPNTESLRSNSMSTLRDDEESPRHKESYEADEPEAHRRSHDNNDNDDNDRFYDEDLEDARIPSAHTRRGRIVEFTTKAASKISSRAWRVLMLAYNTIDRTILILGFIAFALGIATYGRFFEGRGIFSGLAHWIKGGVFFWLGLLTLGRWAGCFGEWGWAWNVRPKSVAAGQREPWRPSAEFVESFLIFFYGATNVFLEHLGNAGKAYTAQDLEHVSITILFIGGGLCGMLVESTVVRDLLNTTVSEAAHACPETHYSDDEREALRPPAQYRFSVNPFPALVILLLGLMMSSHTQHTMISSMIHKQWGNLLTGAAFARGLTYVLTFLRPPTSILPSRPPTELLAAFGLIAGGTIFMASASDTVDGMIHYGLDAMFMYTVTMGLVGVLMSWEIFVIALKGWAVRKEAGRPLGSYQLA